MTMMQILAGMAGIVIAITSRTVNKIGASPATAIYNLNNDSTVTNHLGSVLENWASVPGSEANYWARATLNSGTLASGSTGVWQQLNTTRTWSVQASGAPGASAAANIDVSIAGDAAGVNILTTATINLTASVP